MIISLAQADVLAVDPGSDQSAYVVAMRRHGRAPAILEFGIAPNDEVLERVSNAHLTCRRPRHLAIEMIASYGMPVGREVFDTCVWIGRFIQAWSGNFTKVFRQDVKLHLCRSVKATDANIRQALLDRYGPGKQALGNKKSPGPLFGVSKDVWAALGVAVTYLDDAVSTRRT